MQIEAPLPQGFLFFAGLGSSGFPELLERMFSPLQPQISHPVLASLKSSKHHRGLAINQWLYFSFSSTVAGKLLLLEIQVCYKKSSAQYIHRPNLPVHLNPRKTVTAFGENILKASFHQ